MPFEGDGQLCSRRVIFMSVVSWRHELSPARKDRWSLACGKRCSIEPIRSKVSS